MHHGIVTGPPRPLSCLKQKEPSVIDVRNKHGALIWTRCARPPHTSVLLADYDAARDRRIQFVGFKRAQGAHLGPKVLFGLKRAQGAHLGPKVCLLVF